MNKSNRYAQLIDPFILYLIAQRRVAHNTSLAYRRDVQQFLDFWKKTEKKIKKKKLSESKIEVDGANKDDLRALLIDFRDFLRNRGVGSRSIARKLSALRAFFQYLNEYHPAEMTGQEVALTVGAPPRLERRLPRVCTQNDIDKLLSVAREERNPVRAELICCLLYTTGLRVSELVGLKRENIQVDIGHITLQGKGGKMRTVPLVPQACEVIRRYEEELKKKKNYANQNLALQQEQDSIKSRSLKKNHVQCYLKMSRQSVWRLIKALARKAGISTPVSPHVLRHSLATHSLEQGWDLRSLQLMLGHERIATTEMYIHLNTRFVKSEYKKRHPRG